MEILCQFWNICYKNEWLLLVSLWNATYLKDIINSVHIWHFRRILQVSTSKCRMNHICLYVWHVNKCIGFLISLTFTQNLCPIWSKLCFKRKTIWNQATKPIKCVDVPLVGQFSEAQLEMHNTAPTIELAGNKTNKKIWKYFRRYVWI